MVCVLRYLASNVYMSKIRIAEQEWTRQAEPDHDRDYRNYWQVDGVVQAAWSSKSERKQTVNPTNQSEVRWEQAEKIFSGGSGASPTGAPRLVGPEQTRQTRRVSLTASAGRAGINSSRAPIHFSSSSDSTYVPPSPQGTNLGSEP